MYLQVIILNCTHEFRESICLDRINSTLIKNHPRESPKVSVYQEYKVTQGPNSPQVTKAHLTLPNVDIDHVTCNSSFKDSNHWWFHEWFTHGDCYAISWSHRSYI